jgi:hypothetical protein
MRPLPDQLVILARAFTATAQLPPTNNNRAALRSLALACVIAIDGMSAEVTAR